MSIVSNLRPWGKVLRDLHGGNIEVERAQERAIKPTGFLRRCIERSDSLGGSQNEIRKRIIGDIARGLLEFGRHDYLDWT